MVQGPSCCLSQWRCLTSFSDVVGAASKSAPALAAVRRRLRETVQGPGTDRYLAPEMEAVVQLVREGSLIRAAGLPLR